jgi:hypothetical protein
MMGVMKEPYNGDNALMEFYTDYFNFPLFMDEDWLLNSVMGSKQLTVWKRFTKKGIHNLPFGGTFLCDENEVLWCKPKILTKHWFFFRMHNQVTCGQMEGF